MRLFLLLTTAVLIAIGSALPQAPSPEVQARIVPLFEAARGAERARDFERAAVLYEDVLRLAPGIAEVWTNKGLVTHELGKHREALVAFQKACELNPRLAVPQLFIGVEQLRLGRAREAIAPIEKALDLEPDNSKALYELARAYLEVESYDRAVTLLSRLIEKDRTPMMPALPWRLCT